MPGRTTRTAAAPASLEDRVKALEAALRTIEAAIAADGTALLVLEGKVVLQIAGALAECVKIDARVSALESNPPAKKNRSEDDDADDDDSKPITRAFTLASAETLLREMYKILGDPYEDPEFLPWVKDASSVASNAKYLKRRLNALIGEFKDQIKEYKQLCEAHKAKTKLVYPTTVIRGTAIEFVVMYTLFKYKTTELALGQWVSILRNCSSLRAASRATMQQVEKWLTVDESPLTKVCVDNDLDTGILCQSSIEGQHDQDNSRYKALIIALKAKVASTKLGATTTLEAVTDWSALQKSSRVGGSTIGPGDSVSQAPSRPAKRQNAEVAAIAALFDTGKSKCAMTKEQVMLKTCWKCWQPKHALNAACQPHKEYKEGNRTDMVRRYVLGEVTL